MTQLSLIRRALVAPLVIALCAPVAGVASTSAPSSAPAPGPALERVTLTPDRDQAAARPAAGYRPVRSATVRVEPSGASRGWQLRGWRTNGFSQVGATWRGQEPALQVRSRARSGRWSAWQELEVLGDGPDRGTGEASPGLRGADLWWAGDARDVQVRVRGGGFRDLEVVLIDPGDKPSDDAGQARPDQVSRAGVRMRNARPSRAPRPRIRRRRAWGADESWRERPRFNDSFKTVHVHHTVNSNSYRRADVPGLIRGMYRYHVFSLGWSDLGYNFVVDKFGRIWQGRAGGAKYKVRGAHTLGFNHNSTGISAIGNFETTRPPRAMRVAIAKFAAWKLDMYGLNPQSRPRVPSTGSDRYRAGSRPRLPRIAGHRDTNQTACPGLYLYNKLPGIRKHAQYRADRFS